MSYFKYCGELGVLILKNLQLKVTPPNEFNDPFEFSPIVHNPNPKEYAHKTVKEMLKNPRAFEENRLAFPNIKNFREFQSFGRANIGSLIEQLAAATPKLDKSLDVLNSLSEISGVVCFSADPVHPLMWAHYAVSHKGIVIEFDEASDFFDPASFLEVNYNAARVEYNPDGSNQRPVVELFAKRKSLHWQYEQEYRLIVQLDQTHEQHNKDSKDSRMHLMDIKPELLKSVTFGLRTTDAIRKEVLLLVGKAPLKHLQVFQIQADEREFKLNRIKIE